MRIPFREWIGALIRNDVYAGSTPATAHMAWTDARLSHTRNGVWVALWAAALPSTSLVASSVNEMLTRSPSAPTSAAACTGGTTGWPCG